jgi:hypothetical protein
VLGLLTGMREEDRRVRRGYVAHRCPACNDAVCCAIETHERRALILWVVPLTPWLVKTRSVLCRCGLAVPASSGEYAHVAPDPGDPLDLMEFTNPALAAEMLAVQELRERLHAGRLSGDDRRAWIEDAIRCASRCVRRLSTSDRIAEAGGYVLLGFVLLSVLVVVSAFVIPPGVPIPGWAIAVAGAVFTLLFWCGVRYFIVDSRSRAFQFAGLAMSEIDPTREEIAAAAESLLREGVELCRHISPDQFAQRVLRSVRKRPREGSPTSQRGHEGPAREQATAAQRMRSD